METHQNNEANQNQANLKNSVTKLRRLYIGLFAGLFTGLLLGLGMLGYLLIRQIYGDDQTATKAQMIAQNSSAQNIDPGESIKQPGVEGTDELLYLEFLDVFATKATETTQAETEAPSEPDYIDLLAVGDNLFHAPLVYACKDSEGNWDFDTLYSRLTPIIQAADIAIINQETPMGGEKFGIQTYPRFNVPQELAQGMVNAGFDVVSFATNHCLDMGKDGLLSTLAYWKNNYPQILTTGINSSQEERDTIPIITCKGVKIAFLNYTYGTNTGNVKSTPYMVNYFKEDLVRQDIQKAKQESDFVVVLMHWGVESRTQPNEEQIQWARILADAGADLVFGAHPHVVEPVTWVDAINPNNQNKTLVFYSLGNFASLQIREARMLEGIGKVRLRVDEVDGKKKVTIDHYQMDFAVMHYRFTNEQGVWDPMIYLWEDYTEELSREHGLWFMENKYLRLDALKKIINSLGPLSGNGYLETSES